MEKPNVDLSVLPEPWQSMLQNIDLETIKQLQANLDPAMMEGLMNTAMGMARTSMRPEDVKMLEEMMGSIMKMMSAGK